MTNPAYDESNVFAKILRGELPSFTVYEDEHTLAFMDIMPRSDGHTLILPKAPSRNLLDADPAVLGPLMMTAQRVAQAAMRAFDADGIMLAQFSEAPAGQTVFHLHVHVIPRYEGGVLRPEGTKGEMAAIEAHAKALKAALAA